MLNLRCSWHYIVEKVPLEKVPLESTTARTNFVYTVFRHVRLWNKKSVLDICQVSTGRLTWSLDPSWQSTAKLLVPQWRSARESDVWSRLVNYTFREEFFFSSHGRLDLGFDDVQKKITAKITLSVLLKRSVGPPHQLVLVEYKKNIWTTTVHI